jgi:hypothetical protein
MPGCAIVNKSMAAKMRIAGNIKYRFNLDPPETR